MIRIKRKAAFLVAGALVFAACGGDDEASDSAEATAEESAPETTVAESSAAPETTVAESSAAPETTVAESSTAVESSTAESSSAPAELLEPITLGAVIPLSGPTAVVGQMLQIGYNAGARWVNENGGVNGHELVIEYRDSGGEEQQAIAGMRELLDDPTVVAAIPGVFGGENAALMPMAVEAGLPTFSSGNTPAAGDVTINPNNFQVVLTAEQQLRATVIAAQTLGVTKIGLIDEDAESGRSRIEILKGLAAEYGFEVVGEALVDFESNDFTPQLQQIRDAGAEAIVGQLSGAPVGVFAQGLADLAWDVPVMGNSSWAAAPLLDLVPESVQPQIQFAQNVSGGRTSDELSENQQALIASIEAAGDELINLSVHSAGFDLVLAMKYAFDAAASNDGAAVIAAAEGMSADPASAELPWQFFPGQGPMFSAEYHNPTLVDVSQLFLLCSIGELVQGTWPCEALPAG